VVVFITVIPVDTAGEQVLIRLDDLHSIVESNQMITGRGGKRNYVFGRNEMSCHLERWVQTFLSSPNYDLFLSYRRGGYDVTLVCGVCDHMSCHGLGTAFRPVSVFVDSYQLPRGSEAQLSWVQAVMNSTVFVPIVSVEALTRLPKHDSDSMDNLIFEWYCALVALAHQKSKLRAIFPVLFGKRDGTTVSNLLEDRCFQRLPNIVPSRTISVANELLGRLGIEASATFSEITIATIVRKLLLFPPLNVTTIAVSSIGDTILGVVREHVVDPIPPPPSVHISPVPVPSPSVRPLESLSLEEVLVLLKASRLQKNCEVVEKEELTGEHLCQCESKDELVELGLQALHARTLFSNILKWKAEGVPVSLLQCK